MRETTLKITFYSNFLNHHQLPFCLEMYRCLGSDFKFVATEPIDNERLNLGYADMSELYPFSLNTYSSKDNYDQGIKLGIESDVVITGSAPEIFIKNRLLENKLTFRYSERILKRGKLRLLDPRLLYSLYENHTKHRNNNLYMLCASAYTAYDFSLVGAYKNKTFKWGYFPQINNYDIDTLIANKPKDKICILWCARFIKLKHPEKVIEAAKRLLHEGYSFEVKMIGIGEMYDEIKQMIIDNNLEKNIFLLGSMAPEKVRTQMENANIFLFTSDFGEGWGAVLNESMNSGCAVVASHAIGSVPFLIENNKNGLVYNNSDVNDLFNCVKRLLDNSRLCEQLGKEAYKTLNEKWNAETAAQRFVQLAGGLLKNKQVSFPDGPCSKAEIIKNNWYKGFKI